MSDKTNKSNLFGKYHDLVLLVLGIVLTALFGGILVSSWQNRAAALTRKAEHRRLEQEAATKVFEELSRLMDSRLYKMRQVHIGLRYRKRSMQQRWDAYREVLNEWNENLNRNLALTQRYFGDERRATLEGEINEGFRALGELLEGGRYPTAARDQAQYREAQIDSLSLSVYRFDSALISDIQKGKVGLYRNEGELQ